MRYMGVCITINVGMGVSNNTKSLNPKQSHTLNPKQPMKVNDRAGNAWYSLIRARQPSRGEDRPCVLCGDNHATVLKTIVVDTFLEYLDKTTDKFKHNHIWTTLENVGLSATAVQQQSGTAKFSETVAVCLACSHWMTRIKSVHVPPLLEFKWHLRTLIALHDKRLDKRVIHRIAKILNQPNNYYRTMFSGRELACIDKIAKSNTKSVNAIISKLYKTANANSLFVIDYNVAELVRG